MSDLSVVLSEDVVIVKKPTSKYAAKKAKKQEEAVLVVSAELAIEPSFEEKAPVDDVFANLVNMVLGDSRDDFEHMGLLRTEAYALKAKAKAIDLGALQSKTEREAWEWRNEQPRDAARQMFNRLHELFKSPADLEIVVAKFKALQNAKDPAYLAECDAFVKRTPRMQKLHLANLERALKVEAYFLDQVALKTKLSADADDKFEEANIIATLHDWPPTEAKHKSTK